MQELEHAGMTLVGAAEHLLRFVQPIRSPEVADLQHCDQHPFGIAQGDCVTRGDALGEFLGHIEGDRHRPQGAIAKPHLRCNPFVVGLVEEAFQR